MLAGRRYRLELTAEQTARCEEFANVLWLKAAPSHILQQTLKDLDRACREIGTFKVRWRSQARWAPSFRFPDAQQIQVERLGSRRGRVKLPKLGWVRFRWSRPLGGEIRSATVSRKSGRWFVSFLVDDQMATPKRHAMPATAVGIDRGVRFAAVTSDGDFHDRAFIRPGEAGRYRRLQQKLSRTHRGSANRAKTRGRMNKITGRVTDRRRDFCAQTADRLVRKYALVVLEDLRIKNMSASASGSLAEPGRQVRQKAGLNRAILDKGWHRLELALTSAARYTGTSVVKVNPAYTSQRCSACGFVTEGNRESQAVFVCKAPDCGHREHADVNAGKNIKAAGLAVSACGDLGAGRSVKQEPVGRVTGRTPHQGIPALQGGEDVKGTVIPWPPPRP
ncbi:RNA-guided endonuclease InsQ/TnpB family protein [Streptomyces gardneri]|uniref:RNA-guided endonuclease InsQ/TnpB family protein n=1 Tax=Streptomyces gardneri TaxID=66892 RepID=UPI0036AE21E4